MRSLIFAVTAVASLVGVTAGAEAGGGCGPAFHRTPGGYCAPNRGPVVVRPAYVYRPYYRPYARCGIRVGPIGIGAPC